MQTFCHFLEGVVLELGHWQLVGFGIHDFVVHVYWVIDVGPLVYEVQIKDFPITITVGHPLRVEFLCETLLCHEEVIDAQFLGPVEDLLLCGLVFEVQLLHHEPALIEGRVFMGV